MVSSNVDVSLARLCSSINYDFAVSSSGYISSVGSRFAVLPPRVNNSGGTVSISSAMSCLSKSNTTEEYDNLTLQVESDDPVETEFSKINASYFGLLKEIRESNEKGTTEKGELKNRLISNANDFKNFINKNPESPLAGVALTTAANSFSLYEDYAGMKNLLDEILNDKKLASLKSIAENLMIDYHININDFEKAVSMADAFINTYKNDDQLSCEGLLKKGLVLAHKLNQPEKAIECYSAIVENYPENPLAEYALHELKVLGKEGEIISKDKLSEGYSEFSTSSYPNPFNPVTVINYTLPTDENVTIKVYDILGSEIATLVNEHIKAGEHTVSFNGSNLSSGIYFYSINAGKYSKTMKMILAK